MTTTSGSHHLIARLLSIILLALTACGAADEGSNLASGEGKLNVLATTTIIADIARNVGGQQVDVQALLPTGSDPHEFEPAPRDIARLSEADVVFVNGLGYESFLDSILNQAGNVVVVSEDLETIRFAEGELPDTEGTTRRTEANAGPEREKIADQFERDPHVWFDPLNVVTWTQQIQDALSRLDPENADTYRANGDSYRQELEDLDRWIAQQVALVPNDRRQLVTDHDSLGYFASRYGFELVGTVIPGYSTLAQPSAQELAELARALESLQVSAIFVGTTVDNSLTEQLSQETGAQLVPLYTGSLSGPDGPTATYLEFMRFNVSAIVSALDS